jgi:hypothetical protein
MRRSHKSTSVGLLGCLLVAIPTRDLERRRRLGRTESLAHDARASAIIVDREDLLAETTPRGR